MRTVAEVEVDRPLEVVWTWAAQGPAPLRPGRPNWLRCGRLMSSGDHKWTQRRPGPELSLVPVIRFYR
jgi:hypothetical protein